MDDPARRADNPDPKWPVPLELIEWQPAFAQRGEKGAESGGRARCWDGIQMLRTSWPAEAIELGVGSGISYGATSAALQCLPGVSASLLASLQRLALAGTPLQACLPGRAPARLLPIACRRQGHLRGLLAARVEADRVNQVSIAVGPGPLLLQLRRAVWAAVHGCGRASACLASRVPCFAPAALRACHL